MLSLARRIASRVLRFAADLVEPLDVSPGKRLDHEDDGGLPAWPPAVLEEEAEAMIAVPTPVVVDAEPVRPLRGSFEDRMRRAGGE